MPLNTRLGPKLPKNCHIGTLLAGVGQCECNEQQMVSKGTTLNCKSFDETIILPQCGCYARKRAKWTEKWRYDPERIRLRELFYSIPRAIKIGIKLSRNKKNQYLKLQNCCLEKLRTGLCHTGSCIKIDQNPGRNIKNALGLSQCVVATRSRKNLAVILCQHF